MRKVLVLLALLLTAGWALSQHAYISEVTAYLDVHDGADTAQDVKFTPGFGIDSFTYGCTLQVISGTDTIDDTVEWTAPIYVLRVDPVAADTGYTYACSVAFAGDTLGFTYAIPETTFGTTDSMLEMLVDEFVDSFNNVADLSDSVEAADSGTYLTVTSLFSQETFTERWVFDGANVGDSVDTSSSVVTTVAMVCDSMTVYVNASALAPYLTAYDSSTYWHIVSDDKGLPFTQTVGDTTTDSSQTQANVTSWSAMTDTINLSHLIENGWKAEGVYTRIIFAASTDTSQGIGDADSVWVAYATQSWEGVYDTLGSTSQEGLPCTLLVAMSNDSTGVDTCLHKYTALLYTVKDSASDTTNLVPYVVRVEEMLW
jgi:hypothetical protein